MVYRYELEVKFYDDTASQGQQHDFYEFLRIYDTIGIGHKKTETSTVNISSNIKLTQEGLAKLLGENIPILSFKKVE